MPIEVRPLLFKPHRLNGLSDRLLTSHYENNSIYGFQVSGNTVDELRRRGYDARSLKDGIAAWHAVGGPTVPLDRGRYEA